MIVRIIVAQFICTRQAFTYSPIAGISGARQVAPLPLGSQSGSISRYAQGHSVVLASSVRHPVGALLVKMTGNFSHPAEPGTYQPGEFP